ncbi:MAG TPA: AbrB/MazE/SpoVT family DNA-binding domain-containing protein [Clostridiales bacterium]|nr:AbrB/MazE/SpoVT family DNA-binding domain-containing protein [Clostridiales bacterium]
MQFPKGKFISLVKVGEKGQIVIPKGARELFDIQPGDQLLLMADKKRGIALVGMDDLHVPDSLFRLAKEADDDGNSEA